MTVHADRAPWLAVWLDEESPAVTEVFSEWFGTAPERVQAEIGYRWRRVHDGFADPEFQYWAAGEPVQVVVGLGHRSLVIIEPNGTVFGSVQTVSAREPARIARSRASLTGVASLIRETARHRRRRFRWCDSCFRVVAPEERHGRQCLDCWSIDSGVHF